MQKQPVFFYLEREGNEMSVSIGRVGRFFAVPQPLKSVRLRYNTLRSARIEELEGELVENKNAQCSIEEKLASKYLYGCSLQFNGEVDTRSADNLLLAKLKKAAAKQEKIKSNLEGGFCFAVAFISIFH